MKSLIIVSCLFGAVLVFLAHDVSGEQQRILRRVIKSTPTATNLARVKLVTIRSVSGGSPERGVVAEISGKEAASFGQRSANETTVQQSQTSLTSSSTKTKSPSASPSKQTNPSTTSTTTSTTSTTTTTAPTTQTLASSTEQPKPIPRASDRQQQQRGTEIELLASAPSSWQTMRAIEAPVAALIAAGTRPAATVPSQQVNADLSSSSSEESSDYLRASSSKTNYASQASIGETFSRLRQQQSSKTSQQQQQQQQSFFYPQQQRQSKTSNYQATKTHWYQPSTTPRPAPVIQQQEQQYEQQVEQLVEGPAPAGQAEPFAFDFRTQDSSGNGQYRKEESDNNGVVRGSYGYTDANGIYRHVEYVADHNGFRAKINSNEPGLIGETQPASIKLDSGPAPSLATQRFSEAPNNYNNVINNNNDANEWSAASSSSNERANLALAPPDFESAHKPELLRAPRHFRN